MNFNNHVKIGTVVSKHGYKGNLKINVSSLSVDTLQDLKHIFIHIDDCFIPFMIDDIKLFSKNMLVVKLKEINSEKEVGEIIHKNIYVDYTEVQSKKDSVFSYNEFINFNVCKDSQKIGKIENINTDLPQPVFEIKYGSRIILIPIHENFIKEIDKENNIIHLDIPDGLLEII